MNIDNSRTEDDKEVTGSEKLDRRRFLSRLSLGLGGIGAAIVSIPVIGFLLSPLMQKRPQIWRSVGSVTNFQIGKTVKVSFQDASPLPWAGVTAKTAAWLRRESETLFIAFSINCTHLGCPVRWLADADLFMCPCHGGVYYSDGAVASGPPPKPLSHYPVRVREGRVEILTSAVPLT